MGVTPEAVLVPGSWANTQEPGEWSEEEITGLGQWEEWAQCGRICRRLGEGQGWERSRNVKDDSKILA